MSCATFAAIGSEAFTNGTRVLVWVWSRQLSSSLVSGPSLFLFSILLQVVVVVYLSFELTHLVSEFIRMLAFSDAIIG